MTMHWFPKAISEPPPAPPAPHAAAYEIERLQRSVTDWQLEAEVHRKRAAAAVGEIERLRNGAATSCETVRLKEDEREAIEQAIDAARGGALAEPWTAATLRNLIARLS